MTEKYHAVSSEKSLVRLNSALDGLSEQESSKRIETYGYNQLKEKKKLSIFQIFINQFKNPLVLLLVLAMAVSFFIGHELDGFMILAIIIINALLGFSQDWKASKAIESLSALFVKKARVVRNGKEGVIDARLLVPGDVVILEAGSEVPADIKLINVADLQVSEASLTGESLPIRKTTDVLPADTILPERLNMAYAGTMVMNGWAKGLVIATGMDTELGKIAGLTQNIEKGNTHTQELLETLTKKLVILFLFMCAAIVVIGFFLKMDFFDIVLVGISLAVAAIPEGLPAVVTIVFAIGLRRLSKVNMLVRKLAATETLGAVTFICTDKTGTLTKNEMTVKKIFVDGKLITVSGSGYSTKGDFSEKTKSLDKLLEIGVLCNHASFSNGSITGDPTEAALLVAGAKAGLGKQRLDNEHSILGEISFSMERKMMSVITKNKKGVLVNSKGAPEVIINKCNRYVKNGKILKLSSSIRSALIKENEKLANTGYRVLGFAYNKIKPDTPHDAAENELIYIGSMALIDPVRSEAVTAISDAKKAGINVAIITGDHKSTAVAIARQIGLMDDNSKAINGSELAKLTNIDLQRQLDGIKVFARVTPEQKMRILTMLQHRGDIVAMTGDGVNDAPALKKADIGISMGITGTDVARETAEVVLADDNFATIVNGISEGRTIFLNIRKFVYYLVSSNLAEVLIIFFGMLFGWPLVLIPIQILWINLVTDSITALSLGVDPKPKDIMETPPRDPDEKILTTKSAFGLFSIAGVKTLVVLYLFSLYLSDNVDVARTMAFVGLVFAEGYNLFNFKSFDKPLYKINPFDNKYLIAAVVVTLLLSILVVQLPLLNPLFHTTPLTLNQWLFALGAAAFVLITGELYKNLRYYGILKV